MKNTEIVHITYRIPCNINPRGFLCFPPISGETCIRAQNIVHQKSIPCKKHSTGGLYYGRNTVYYNEQ